MGQFSPKMVMLQIKLMRMNRIQVFFSPKGQICVLHCSYIVGKHRHAGTCIKNASDRGLIRDSI